MDSVSKISGLPVSGYRAQSPEAIASVNAAKQLEEHVLRLLEELADDRALAVDMRWLNMGRSHIEQGFMAVNRAVFKPARVEIEELDRELAETGWVLEREDSSPAAPIYYAPGEPSQWTADHLKACRFAREIDAACFAAAIGVAVRICEHQWSV